MVRYSDELIDEIKNKNDIVDVIGSYVALKRSGRSYFGLCPFHNEKSPSFAVSPDKQIFHCFGCGVGGNVFHFVSKIEGVGFRDAIEILANRANVSLPVSSSNDEDDKLYYMRSRIYQINEATALFYHQNIYKPTAKLAQEYVKKRKLDNNTLKTFYIGYSGNYNELYNHLKSLGFKDEEILASKLVNQNDKGEFIDRFRKRLMFPIQDERGKFIAFGGRILIDPPGPNASEEEKLAFKKQAKYINSTENIVYSKGRHLFGLYAAKKAAHENSLKKILIVEGYMDTISLHQRGITNVVASLGTALTEAQGRLLRKSSEQVIVGYDADGAGQAATMRGLEILQNLGCDVRILQIEGAKDPDEYILKYGPERLLKCMDNAISLVEFKIKNLKKDLNLSVANDKIKFLTEIAKELSRVSNSIEKEVYIDKIALDYKISKEAIYAEINKILYAKENSNKMLEKKNSAVKPKIVNEDYENISASIIKRENLIIYLLINYPEEAYSKIKDNISLDLIKSDINKKIIEKLYEELEKGNNNVTTILDVFKEEDIVNHLSGIMATDFEITEVKKCIEDVILNYEKDKLIAKRNNIIKQLENTNELTKDEVASLEKELSELIIKLARMK
ncbi:MAG: DNA primase [Clostridia bacterium]|nr:DNA primase [Clostridia bacterium]